MRRCDAPAAPEKGDPVFLGDLRDGFLALERLAAARALESQSDVVSCV